MHCTTRSEHVMTQLRRRRFSRTCCVHNNHASSRHKYPAGASRTSFFFFLRPRYKFDVWPDCFARSFWRQIMYRRRRRVCVRVKGEQNKRRFLCEHLVFRGEVPRYICNIVSITLKLFREKKDNFFHIYHASRDSSGTPFWSPSITVCGRWRRDISFSANFVIPQRPPVV